MSTTAENAPVADRASLVRAVATAHKDEPGALMPILHEVMEQVGWISRDDIGVIADVLNVTTADVHGVVSFYHDFRTTPPPAHRMQLCRGEACQTVGAEKLFDAQRDRFAKRDDVEVAEVFCLGVCAVGPAGMVDNRLVGRLSESRVEELTQGWVK